MYGNKQSAWGSAEKTEYITTRAKSLAIMYLTRRSDLQVAWNNDEHNKWLDGKVVITGGQSPSRREFGLKLEGSRSPGPVGPTNEKLRRSLSEILKRLFSQPSG